MPLRFAYTRPDGGTSIVHALPREQIERALPAPFADDAAYVRHVLEVSIPADATDVVRLPDDHELPKRCEYRDAWKLSGGRVVFDMPKARNIHRNRIRAARAPVLTALDAEYQVADEASDAAAKASVAARKQELRDAPADPAIDSARTVDDLRKVWPRYLGERS
jgi:hypothetical protein